MEEALKKATEEAHKQRMALEAVEKPLGAKQSLTQETSDEASTVESKALQLLKQ